MKSLIFFIALACFLISCDNSNSNRTTTESNSNSLANPASTVSSTSANTTTTAKPPTSKTLAFIALETPKIRTDISGTILFGKNGWIINFENTITKPAVDFEFVDLDLSNSKDRSKLAERIVAVLSKEGTPIQVESGPGKTQDFDSIDSALVFSNVQLIEQKTSRVRYRLASPTESKNK